MTNFGYEASKQAEREQDTGWRCWPVENWGPVTIGADTNITGQYQWLWRRVGNWVVFGARFKRDTTYTVASGSVQFNLATPHPESVDSLTDTRGTEFRINVFPNGGTGSPNPMAMIEPRGVMLLQATTAWQALYAPGTWVEVLTQRPFLTDDPFPATLPGEAYTP